jgi:multidrug resistance efflux pump
LRYFRLVIGALVLVGALYLITAEQMAGASSDAVINAPVIALRSPVAGTVDLEPLALGAVVRRGQTVATVDDPQADRVRMNDLLLERDLALAEVNRLTALRDGMEVRQQALAEQTERYHVFRRRELGVAPAASGSGAAGLFDPRKLEDDTAGSAAETVSDEAAEAPAEDAPLEAGASARDIRQVAAGEDVFLDGSASPVWNHDLRLFDAEFRLTELSADLKAASARLSAYTNRLERERLRVNALSGASLVAPFDGIVWERMAADGVTVQRGDPVIRLANCDDVIVTLSVTEQVYNTLETGDPATFRISGTDEVMRAQIARLAGAGAATVYRELAVAPSERHLERYDVSLIVPELASGGAHGCQIGRTGRAFFDDRPLDFLRGLWD